MGTPEQCPTTLNGEAEVLLPWRPMRQLKTGCHGNQFGSLWGHPNGLVPGSWQQCWSMRAWDGWDSWMLQSRAEPHGIPQMGYQGAKLE